MDKLKVWGTAAWKDGYDAAQRIGRYLAATNVPECPYTEDAPERDAWGTGFSDGTDDLIAWRSLD